VLVLPKIIAAGDDSVLTFNGGWGAKTDLLSGAFHIVLNTATPGAEGVVLAILVGVLVETGVSLLIT